MGVVSIPPKRFTDIRLPRWRGVGNKDIQRMGNTLASAIELGRIIRPAPGWIQSPYGWDCSGGVKAAGATAPINPFFPTVDGATGAARATIEPGSINDSTGGDGMCYIGTERIDTEYGDPAEFPTVDLLLGFNRLWVKTEWIPEVNTLDVGGTPKYVITDGGEINRAEGIQNQIQAGASLPTDAKAPEVDYDSGVITNGIFYTGFASVNVTNNAGEWSGKVTAHDVRSSLQLGFCAPATYTISSYGGTTSVVGTP